MIKRGWDWLGVLAATPDRIGGLIEVPALAGCLTLNKADFIRSGPRGATYLAYRKAIQEAVSRQLEAWGDARDGAEGPRRAARPVERDLERLLVDLADDYPLLASLIERRAGGQRKLPIASGRALEARELVAAGLALATEAREGAEPSRAAAAPDAPPAPAAGPDAPPEPDAASPDAPAADAIATGVLPAPAGPRRPARYGLGIQFEARSEELELGRLVESTVWVNTAHPAYRRAVASRSEGYHIALAVAMALAPLAVEPAGERSFVTAFLHHWGGAVAAARTRRRG